MKKENFIYILTNQYNTTFYVGVTSNLIKRVYEHKNKILKGFSNSYNLTKLVYFEVFNNIQEAITREKQIKNWHRKWKQSLIESLNPAYIDLYNNFPNSHAELADYELRLQGELCFPEMPLNASNQGDSASQDHAIPKPLGCSLVTGDELAKPDSLPSAHNPQVRNDRMQKINAVAVCASSE